MFANYVIGFCVGTCKLKINISPQFVNYKNEAMKANSKCEQMCEITPNHIFVRDLIKIIMLLPCIRYTVQAIPNLKALASAHIELDLVLKM